MPPRPPEELLEPGEPVDDHDSWSPPDPALGGPGQLVAAVLGTIVAILLLLGTIVAVSWLFRP